MPDSLLPPDSSAPAAPAEASAAPPTPSASHHVAEDIPAPEADEAVHEPETVEAETGLAEHEEAAPPSDESTPASESADEGIDEAPAPVEAEPESNKRWYIVKVQSGREDTIKEAIERRVKIEGLEEFYGEIHIPTETVVEMRKGKRVKKERKLYPGYLMARVEYNDRILYLFRETSGVGDFVGGTITRPPPPMPQKEVDTMLRKGKQEEPGGKVIPSKPEHAPGDRVKVKDGAFAGMEGEVKEIIEAKGQVRVEVTIFGRPVSLELEYWQVESI